MATKKTGSLKGTDVVLITSVNLAADVGASVLPVANGGTGTGTWTDGQIAIGNTTGNTLVKTTLTGTSNQVVVTNGAGAITLSLPQSIATTSSPTFAALTVNGKINGVTNGTATGEVLTFDAIGVSVQAYSASTTLLGNTVTGTGSIVLATSPTLVTPVLGVASATSLTATSTTEQLRLRYDSSNYLSTTVSSGGAVTFDAVGASAGFTFSDAVTVAGTLFLTGTLPYVDVKPSGWASSGYIQFGVSPSFAASGNYGGLYVPAGKGIAFTQAGTTLLLIDVGGNVGLGVGATAPLAKFESRTTSGAQIVASFDASNHFSTTVSSLGAVTFDATGASAGFSFSDSVAIGVATPLYPLHVNLSSGDNQLYVSSGTPSSIAGDSYLMLGSSRADTGVGHICKIRSVAVSAGKADLAFLTQPSNGVYTERMRIDNAGYVGIGTTVPTSALSVVGVVKMEASSQRRPALTSSNFGYSANFRTLMLGSSSTTYNTADTGAVTLAFGVDVSANAGGTFTGDGSELLFRNVVHFITPDSGNTNYQKVMTFNNGNVGLGGIIAPTAVCHTGASTTARASLCLPHGAAPTTPVNGDIWTTTAGLFTRINGVTNGVGDVVGPASSVTGAASVFSGTTGKLLRASPTVTYYSVAAGAEDKIEFGATFKDFRTATDGATVTFDLDLSDQWQVTFAGNRTLAVSNASVGQVITILRYQDATGNRTPTWWANIAWDNGLAPVDVPTASGWSMTVLACVGLDAYSVPNWKEVCRSTSAPLTGITTATDGATVTFDLRVSPRQKVTLAGNRTLALTSGSYYVGQTFDIKLTQDATGSRTVTWWSAIKWTGGTIPTLTTTAGKSDWFRFICTDASGSPKFDILGTSMNLGA